MTSAVRRFAILIICVAAVACAGTVARVPAKPGPRLVVLISVDQMRADYVDRFRHQWTGGLRRLVDRGAWFQQAAYPYLNTVTCPGHASIATGSVPSEHGQVLNEWWDRATQQMVTCTADDSVRAVSYGAPVKDAHSGARLRVPTLADEMRAQLDPTPRVVTMSLKARSAIMLAGHRGDAVTWFDNRQGEWVTSTAYSEEPVPHLTKFLAGRPFRSDFGQIWTRLMPASGYLYEDSVVGRTPPKPWGPSLPHELGGAGKQLDRMFYDQWESSPFSDAYLAQMAIASLEGMGLGSDDRVDFLGISFSALDKVGHDFGPLSHETQDLLARLDTTLGLLLDALDARVGPDRYLVGLTADHGVGPIPDQMKALGVDAGRIDGAALGREIDATIARRYGPGKYVAIVEHTDVYFAPNVYGRLSQDPETLAAVMKTIGAWPGVWRVYRGDMLSTLTASDRVAAAAALSFLTERSGDLILVPKPYWITTKDGAATHGTLHEYDARVPLILMGAPFKPGTYVGPSSPTDLAPTLAYAVGVTLARPHGRLLREALTSESGTKATESSRR